MAKKRSKTCRYKTEPLYSLDIKRRHDDSWESRVVGYGKKKFDALLKERRQWQDQHMTPAAWSYRVRKVKDKKVCK
jgi:hypothetical protein